MNKNQIHFEYCNIVNKINALSQEIKEKNGRYEYHFTQATKCLRNNKEQAEAYAERAIKHKEKLLELIQQKTELEIQLSDMPRVWNV